MNDCRRKVYRSQARRLIYTAISNVQAKSLREEGPISERKLLEKVEDITGVCRTTLRSIKRKGDSGEEFATPGKKHKGRKSAIDDLDEFDKDIIRRTVREFYVKREYPTLHKIWLKLKDKIDFQYGPITLRTVLLALGFQYETINCRTLLLERSDIVCLRREYLRRVRKARADGRTLICLDETWLSQAHKLSKCWQGEGCKGGFSGAPLGKGRRLIILSAGSDQGFVPGSHLVFQANSKKGDYHDEMNGENFQKWFKTQLLPNLPPKCAIILDNASYHCVQVNRAPTTSSTKKQIQEWLTASNIQWEQGMLKAELLQVVKEKKGKPRYVLEDLLLADDGDHILIYLPPYHCNLNPIELIWAQVKNWVATNNTTFKMNDVNRLCRESLDRVTPSNWSKACDHTRKIEDEYWETDMLVDEGVEQLIINIGGRDDSDSEDTSDVEAGIAELSGSSTDTASETE